MTNPKLETIRNMLSKAADVACPAPEAEALTAMAAKLMAKYGIEQAMLDAARPQSSRAEVINRRMVCEAPYAMEKASLIYALVEAMGGKGILLRASGPNETVHLFGFADDLDRAELLYTSLLLQSVNALRRAEYAGERPERVGVKAWRRSFLASFNATVARRVKVAEDRARADAETERAGSAGPSVELVVADRGREVAQSFTAQYPKVAHTSRRVNGSASAAGRAAGERANLGGRAVAGGRAQIGA